MYQSYRHLGLACSQAQKDWVWQGARSIGARAWHVANPKGVEYGKVCWSIISPLQILVYLMCQDF